MITCRIINKKVLLLLLLFLFNPYYLLAQHLYTKGLLVFNSSSDVSNVVKLYNQSGNLLKQFAFVDAFDANPVVKPYLHSAEYGFLMFNLLSDAGSYYKVVIDEKKRQIGYIPKTDKRFKFESWPEHLVSSVAAVDFDKKQNPLHSQAIAGSSVLKSNNIEFFFPKQVKGDWLKVAWNDPKKGEGWIKWKTYQNDLLIELFYVM